MTRVAIAFGDLHIGQGSSIDKPGERIADQAAAVELVLSASRVMGVRFVLFAGDAWERRTPTPDEMLALERALLGHIESGGAPIIAIPGNHDVGNADAGTALDVLAEAGLLELYRRPDVVRIGDDIAVAVMPWVPVHRLVAQAGGGDRDEINRIAARQLEDVARGLRAQIEPGRHAILLSHFSVSSATTDTGADVSVFREPVLSADELAGAGFDAVVLGHIHKQQAVRPNVHYTGSLVPLNFGETGEHGYLTLDISDEGVRVSRVPVVSRRFVTLDVDLPDDVDDALETLETVVRDFEADADPLAPFVRLRYRCSQEVADAIDDPSIVAELERFCRRAFVVPIVERASRARVAIAEDGSDLEALEAYLRAGEDLDDDRLAEMLRLGADYIERTS